MPSRQPLISIVTSVYKGGVFIRPFLEDITRQTVFHQCELRLINADSPEDEEPTIKEFQSRFPNIFYDRLSRDPGLYRVWNQAIQEARGMYITNANLDDRKTPDSLERHVEELKQHPEIDVVCGALKVTYYPNETWEQNRAHTIFWNDGPRLFSAKDMFYEERIRTWGFRRTRIRPKDIPHCMPMWKKSIHKKCGYFDEDQYGPIADWAFWLQCSSEGVTFKLLGGEPVGLYYFNPQSHNKKPRPREEQIKLQAAEQALLKRYYRS